MNDTIANLLTSETEKFQQSLQTQLDHTSQRMQHMQHTFLDQLCPQSQDNKTNLSSFNHQDTNFQTFPSPNHKLHQLHNKNLSQNSRTPFHTHGNTAHSSQGVISSLVPIRNQRYLRNNILYGTSSSSIDQKITNLSQLTNKPRIN